MIDKKSNSLIQALNAWRKSLTEREDKSRCYIDPKGNTFYARINDESRKDIIERIFQNKRDLGINLDEVIKEFKKRTNINITKEQLLMYLGYIYVREGNESLRVRPEHMIPTHIEFCSKALNENGTEYCKLVNIRFGKDALIDIYETNNSDKKDEIAAKKRQMEDTVRIVRELYKAEKDKQQKTKGEHTDTRY